MDDTPLQRLSRRNARRRDFFPFFLFFPVLFTLDSGVQTVRFKNELERNITIKLGYANAKIYGRVNPPDNNAGAPPRSHTQPPSWVDAFSFTVLSV